MEVHFKPVTEARLHDLAVRSGRSYLQELAEVRQLLDRRYDDIESGRVKPIDGDAFFDDLREREDQ